MISMKILPIGNTEDAFSYQLGKLRAAVRHGLIDPEVGTLSKQAQLLTEHCMMLTPPRNKSQGDSAIAGDLFGGKRISSARYSSVGLFQRIGGSSLAAPRGEGTTTVGVHLGWERSTTIRIMKQFWRPDASMQEMEAFHKRYRNPRTGRPGHISQSVIGRWKVQDQMWVKNATAAAYFRKVKSAVGWARAGWLRAYLALGGTRAPDWVRRHGPVRGQFIDGRLGGDVGKWFIGVYNDTGWGKNRDESSRVVGASLAARANAMKSYFNKMMELASNNFGKAA